MRRAYVVAALILLPGPQARGADRMQAKLDKAILYLDAGELNKALDLFSDVWLEGNAEQKAIAIEHLHMMVEDVGGASGNPGSRTGPTADDFFRQARSAKPVLEVVHSRRGKKAAKASAPPKTTVQSVTIGARKPSVDPETALASAAPAMAAGKAMPMPAPGIDPAVLEQERREKAELKARIAALEGELAGAKKTAEQQKTKAEEAAKMQARVEALQQELARSREANKKIQEQTEAEKKAARLEAAAKLDRLEQELAKSRESAKRMQDHSAAEKAAKLQMNAKVAKLEQDLIRSRESAKKLQEEAEAEKALQAQEAKLKQKKLEHELAESRRLAKKLKEEVEEERALSAPVSRSESIDIASLPKDEAAYGIQAPVRTKAFVAKQRAAAAAAAEITAREEGAALETNVKRAKQAYVPEEDPYDVGDRREGGGGGRHKAKGARLAIEDATEAEVEKTKEEVRDINFAENNMELTPESSKLLESLKPLFAKEPAEVVVRGFASPMETNPERLAKVRAKLIEKLVRRQFDVPSDRISSEWGVGIGNEDQKVTLVIRR